MKLTLRTTLAKAAVLGLAALTSIAPLASAQEAQEEINTHPLMFAVKPLQNGNMDEIMAQSAASTGLKMWTYTIKSTRAGSKGQSFKGVMVGQSPITNKGTTTTNVYVVPLIVKIAGHTFNPTVADSACLAGKVPLTVLKQSPMIVATHDFKINGIDVGKGQYSDAFQRANFWKNVSANGGTYHNNLAYKYLPAVTISPGTANSTLYPITSCITEYGGIEINWFDSYLTGTLIPSLVAKGVGPSNLVTFVLYNTTMYISTSGNCCVGGYHGAFGSPVQTYSPFQFDTAAAFGVGSEDTDIMAHEINEWQDDPLGTNPTPAWGKIGQVSGCQTNLEVGDPLTGTNYPNVVMSGFTYHLQELAFYSWFYGPPSIGAGAKFSDNGTFKAAQGACQ
jgi:hypothetical protein